MSRSQASIPRWRVYLYGCTILLSALLLFSVQPLLGRLMLPQFGGSSAVWTTCLLFFQAVLVLGYLYAYASSNFLSASRQATLHVGLLVASITALPIALKIGAPLESDSLPQLRLLATLIATAGLPYLLLSSTGPLLQAWYSQEPSSPIPYRLFALSNLGSFAGLLAYPLLIEPSSAIHGQCVG